MRVVTYGAACSLDGYIAGPNEDLSWLRWTDDVGRISGAYMARVDTILTGRKTYEAGRRQGGGSYAGYASYVFSRTLTKIDDDDTTLVTDDAATFVKQLKARPGAEICLMGGGELARSLFEADLIDRVGVNVHPIILGRGTPLLPQMTKQVSLELIDLQRISGDCLYALYSVSG